MDANDDWIWMDDHVQDCRREGYLYNPDAVCYYGTYDDNCFNIC